MTTTDRQEVLHRLGALSSAIVTAIAKEPNEAQLDVLIEEVRQALIDIGGLRKDDDDKLTPLDDFMRLVVERLERLKAPASNASLPLSSGIGSGFIDLDAITAGLRPGELIVVAGAARVGKTAFALNIAEHVALKERRSVVIFSMRQSGWEITERLLSLTGMIDAGKLRTGQLKEIDWEMLTRALGNLLGSEVRICESESVGPTRLKMRCRELIGVVGALGLVIVDDLQCMIEPNATGRASAETNLLLLKALARELDVPVIVLSNLSHQTVEQDDKWPWLSYMGDGGSNSRDIDWLLLIHRNQNCVPEDNGFGHAEVIVARGSDRPIGAVRLLFDPKRFCFMNRTTRFQEEYIPNPSSRGNPDSWYSTQENGGIDEGR